MKALKITLITIGAIIAAIGIWFGVYYLIYRQGVIEPFEVNNPNLQTKVLIASQGRDFKRELVKKLTERIGAKNIYIKVIDVTTLSSVKPEEWNAIILINTIQWYALQKDVDIFLTSAKSVDNIVMLATSGEEDMKPRKKYRIDTITSASKMDDVDKKLNEILGKLKPILGTAVKLD
ncbi:hypothetical protein ACFL6D_02530 [Spirochaetota bacterium]